MMKPHERIRQQRLKIGLSETDLAHAAGISDMAYYDLEAYESEIDDCIELGQLRRICSKLQLDIVELLGVTPVGVQQNMRILLRSKRAEKGLSIEDVSDQVGISEEAIRDAEKDLASLKTWRLIALRDYAACLNIELGYLLGR